ncbi:hypothetical protein D3C86_1749910 [compost metagenome]
MQAFRQFLEVGDAGSGQTQGLQPLHEGGGDARRQHVDLPGVESIPQGVLLWRIGGPVLRNGPVGGGAWRRRGFRLGVVTHAIPSPSSKGENGLNGLMRAFQTLRNSGWKWGSVSY